MSTEPLVFVYNVGEIKHSRRYNSKGPRRLTTSSLGSQTSTTAGKYHVTGSEAGHYHNHHTYGAMLSRQPHVTAEKKDYFILFRIFGLK